MRLGWRAIVGIHETRTIIGLSENLDRPPKTRTLVQTVVATAASEFNTTGTIYDLADFGPSLGVARRLADLDAPARTALEVILSAGALVVGSPVYKRSYTGLFKHLIDLIGSAGAGRQAGSSDRDRRG